MLASTQVRANCCCSRPLRRSRTSSRPSPLLQPSLAALQNQLTPLQVAQADGCHLNRRTLEDIRAAGFSQVEGEYYELDGFGLLKPQVCGYAVA